MTIKSYLPALLFASWASLAICDLEYAQPIPQHIDERATFVGGVSLFAMTPNTGEDGVCPSYAPSCGTATCCPDGCCPVGTTCVSSGNYCCPSAVDCSSVVLLAPTCSNSSWVLYARAPNSNTPYFCCEPDQIGVLPNLCVPNNITVDTQQLATIIGGKPAGSTASAQSTKANTASAAGGGSTGSSSALPSTTSSATGKSAAERSYVSGNWPIAVGLVAIAVSFGLRVILQ